MKEIVVKVRMTDTIFKNFSFFNNFKKDNKAKTIWILPIIMLAFGLPMFWVNSPVIGIVMIAFGLLYPILYTGFFYLVINKQIVDLELKKGKDVYVCTFSNKGLKVEDYSDNEISFKWSKFYKAFEVEDCFYIYAIKEKAYLIPKQDVQNDELEDLKNLLQKKLSPDRYISK